jgi:hypothetical protein
VFCIINDGIFGVLKKYFNLEMKVTKRIKKFLTSNSNAKPKFGHVFNAQQMLRDVLAKFLWNFFISKKL